jgi:hypothetical protein
MEGQAVRSIIEGIVALLARSGWAVLEQRTVQTDQSYASDHLLTLDSTQPPRGVRVEMDVRIYHGYREWDWNDEQLLGVTVRYQVPPADAGVVPEAYLTGGEAQPGGYRQLLRVLTWFRDPLSGALWEERPEPGDWVPPSSWEAERWGPQFGLEYRWRTSTAPLEMLRHLPGRPDIRKLQLVACACCRLLPLEMSHERNVLAIAAVERYAEGQTPRREMKKVCKHSDMPWLAQLEPLPMALRAVEGLIASCPSQGPRLAADIVREVLGDPFHPVALRHSWLRQEGGAVRHLAESIAAEGRFEELPILADALEDAGCIEPVLLEHLRGPGEHVRGCWALDLLRRVERR